MIRFCSGRLALRPRHRRKKKDEQEAATESEERKKDEQEAAAEAETLEMVGDGEN
jgi:hypothetical protein